MAQTQIPHEALDQRFGPEDLSYFEGLYREGLAMDGTAEARDQHFQGVAELVGDMALYELLGQKVEADWRVAQTFAEQFKTTRAKEGAAKMETRGFAKTAPKFDEQLRDESRTTPFIYNHLPPHIDEEGWQQHRETEIEGLHDLDSFLSLFLETSKRPDGSFAYPEDAEQAQSILDNLTFIGEKEYDEASRGLAVLWKNYLDGDPKRKLYVLAKVTNSEKYPDKRKSDDYLKERIFQFFTDEDQEKYAGRIMEDIDGIQAEDPGSVRIVLLDDWAISGRQMARVYRQIAEDPDNEPFLDAIEAHFLVASEERLKKGFQNPDDPSGLPTKVRSYYKSHYAEKAQTENKGHVTGLHCTVNFDFGDTIERIVKRFDKLGIPFDLPPLASIVRSYRKAKQPKIEETSPKTEL